MEFLNEVYDGKCAGRGELVPWTAWFPDLNPTDLFLWGCMRSRVNEGGKPEASYQPVEVNDETAVGI
jgi:hypothetical protein